MVGIGQILLGVDRLLFVLGLLLIVKGHWRVLYALFHPNREPLGPPRR